MSAPLSVMPLRGGVYWVSGGVSNTGFIVGDTGVIAIDAQMFVPTARRELAEIAKITSKPVNAIILTHSDPDHINGLPAYPAGLQVIAQERVKAEILAALEAPRAGGLPTPPQMRDFLPNLEVGDSKTLVLDGVRIVLTHVAAAHTDGDLVVYLPEQKIVFAGDLVTPAMGAYPVIHLNKHGSSLGWIASVKAMLALDAEIYICGHGDRVDRDQLRTRLSEAVRRRAEIKGLFDRGKSLEQIKIELHDADPPSGDAAMFPGFTQTVFQELGGPAGAAGR